MVRAFAATGDETAVQRQLDASIDLFRRELGSDVGPELYAAARMDMGGRSPGHTLSRASAQALLESGEAAVSAGATETGIDELERATVAARDAAEPELEAAALFALGSALVHAAKGRDEEGSAALHRAIAVAESTGERRIEAASHRELGYVELLRGEYPRANVWLKSAMGLADGDPLEMARIRSVVGVGLSDVGRHEQAEVELLAAIDLAASADNGRQNAWATTCLGRTRLLCDELEAAEEVLGEAREMARAERWTAFISYPEALLAEVWVRMGRSELASEAFEHAFTLGCSVDDACWEAYSVRGLGLLKAAGGNLEGSVELMEDALTRCLRQRDTHRWIRAYVMDALCATAIAVEASAIGRVGHRPCRARRALWHAASSPSTRTCINAIWVTRMPSTRRGSWPRASRILTSSGCSRRTVLRCSTICWAGCEGSSVRRPIEGRRRSGS